jgi:flagellar P-ring protein precursor FlgI
MDSIYSPPLMMKIMRKFKKVKVLTYLANTLTFGLIFWNLTISLAFADARIKDIVNFEGVRENMLVGYGLVVGLNGTGDNLKNSAFTEKGLKDFLEKLGVNTKGANLKTKNVAAVMVTASLPAFARTGNKIDINVSTMGDAKSLKGGTLLATTLLGADGEVYAIAQGPMSIGEATAPMKANLAAGYIAAGAIVEREVAFQFNALKHIKCALKNPDITTARAIATTINAQFDSSIAVAEDPGTVILTIPQGKGKPSPLNLLADIENLNVYTDTTAKIIIDQATGTIVVGENVKISPVAISHGNLNIKISPEQQFFYSMSGEEPGTSVPGQDIAMIEGGQTLQDLVQALNTLGIGPKDMISILKTIKGAGALQAEIEVV